LCNHSLLFSLVWLDIEVNVKINQEVQRQLRLLTNDLTTFEEKEKCQHHIESRSTDDRIVFIVSGRFGRELVPTLDKHENIASIYVYCLDKESNEKWANTFSKVKLR
jgi:hypothetical protein